MWRTFCDTKLWARIGNCSKSMGEKLYLAYEMRAMRGKDTSENNKHHDDEHERSMNASKGG